MKRYKLTKKGHQILEGIIYIITTGVSAALLLFALVYLSILIATLVGWTC